MSDNQSAEELVKIFSDHFRPPTYLRESTVESQGSIKTTFSFLEIEVLYSELGCLGIVRVVGNNLNLYSTPNKIGIKFEDTCGLLKDWIEMTTSELNLLLFKPQNQDKEEPEEVKSTYLAKVAVELAVTLVDDSLGLLHCALQKPLDELTQEEMQQFYISLEEGVKEEVSESIDQGKGTDLFQDMDIISVRKIS